MSEKLKLPEEHKIREFHRCLKQTTSDRIAYGEFASEFDFVMRLLAELTLRTRALERVVKSERIQEKKTTAVFIFPSIVSFDKLPRALQKQFVKVMNQ